MRLQLTAIASLLIFLHAPAGRGETYQKATEGNEVVKGKLYEKRGDLEVAGPDFGLIMNQSYIDTYLLHGGVNYYFNEVWGFGIDGAYAMNQDKDERTCIENFYNNPDRLPGDVCGGEGGIPAKGNYGPAYVPIREIKFLFGGNAIWSPVYGKQLLLMSSVIHFDLFVTFGGGIAMADYYEKQQILRNGKPSRTPPGNYDPTQQTPEEANFGCSPPRETGCYGEEGRPDPQSETNIYASASFGQRLHINRMINIKLELKDFLLLGTEDGFSNLLALWGGVGFRF